MATANAGRINYAEPGPIDTLVLTQQPNHQSEAIWNGQVKRNTKSLTNVHAFNSYNVHAAAILILIHGSILCKIQGPLPAAAVVQSSPIESQWWMTESLTSLRHLVWKDSSRFRVERLTTA